jgi:SpoVK/Ycf46/Vps4 family AAA+-type ATPase
LLSDPTARGLAIMTDVKRLEQLMLGRHPCIAVTTHEEAYVLSLIRGCVLRPPYSLRMWSTNGGLRDGLLLDVPPVPETEHPAAALCYLFNQTGPGVYLMLDLAEHLGDARTRRLLRDLIEHCRQTNSQLILLDPTDDLPPIIRTMTTRFDVHLPNRTELEQIVRHTLRHFNDKAKLDIKIGKHAFETILRNLSGLTRRQVEQIIIETVAEDHRFDATDLQIVLTRKRQMIHGDGLLEFIETPADLNAIGGMHRLKKWLMLRANVFSKEAAAFGLTAPRGILLLGVQGAGKSFCAKGIATAWQRPLLRMDVGALYDRYVGESERRLRDALRQAERMAPVLLWIDEIEKAFASAASRSTDGGLSQRMFGSLLTWMQEHKAPVFLVATANDIEALPPEMLRKGRFDEIFFVDLPAKATRSEILSIHLRKRGRDPGAFDLNRLADEAEGFTGAEIEQAILSAMHAAFADGSEIDTERIGDVLRESPPLSVTQAERIDALRRWADGRCVPAD